MKSPLIIFAALLLCLSGCTNNRMQPDKKPPLVVNKTESLAVDNVPGTDSASAAQTTEPLPPKDDRSSGEHPISLQWIGWNKRGLAKVEPAADGWYTISGSQLSANNEYLKIDGKIRRVNEKELAFVGTVETRVRMNNGGKPCIKKGKQKFYAKDNRKFFRMQNMSNCQQKNLLDYVDIFPGSSSL